MANNLPRLSSRAALLGAALLVWPNPGISPTVSLAQASGADPVAYASNPPLGHTGGFGEPTCQACHTDAELNHPDATLTVEGLPEQYRSGDVYRVTIALAGSGQGRNGFEAALRFAEGSQRGLQAGNLVAVDGRVVVRADTLTAVQYAAHSTVGADPVSVERGEWVIQWTAPRSSDAVVLHVAGNSANGDDSPFGDLIHTLERTSAGPTP